MLSCVIGLEDVGGWRCRTSDKTKTPVLGLRPTHPLVSQPITAVEYILMWLLSSPRGIGLQQRDHVFGINRNDVFDVGLVE